MSETTIPVRVAVCLARTAGAGGSERHVPVPTTVENESSTEMEWQFGSCMYCGQSISRFRVLRGGTWFDHWGNVAESAYLIENSGHTA
jgi:hypothetical protein